mmetsp:Transcript_28712/g.72185  ORF Transcript_28712/g.72185 Transcript_28712/m.72185 type:complete len:279 (-) Transcript_28712:2167-3003(-)
MGCGGASLQHGIVKRPVCGTAVLVIVVRASGARVGALEIEHPLGVGAVQAAVLHKFARAAVARFARSSFGDYLTIGASRALIGAIYAVEARRSTRLARAISLIEPLIRGAGCALGWSFCARVAIRVALLALRTHGDETFAGGSIALVAFTGSSIAEAAHAYLLERVRTAGSRARVNALAIKGQVLTGRAGLAPVGGQAGRAIIRALDAVAREHSGHGVQWEEFDVCGHKADGVLDDSLGVIDGVNLCNERSAGRNVHWVQQPLEVGGVGVQCAVLERN